MKLKSDQFRNVRTPSVLTDFHPSAEYISSWHKEKEKEEKEKDFNAIL
jgi:hypothetical protein